MTARVNLLPGSVRERDAAGRQRALAGGIVLIVILGLAVATFLQRGVLNDAEDELASAQSELAAARAEVAELAEFEDLEGRLVLADDLLRSAMGEDVTLAGILQDVALVVPTEGAITSLAINIDPEGVGIGTLNANAEATEQHAPGVERFLLHLERPAGFRGVYPGGSTIDEDDIATFSFVVQLGPEYLTNRYEDGLPEVAR
jgi:Tfp pilus assembly protein PilN